jgi:hypothetical protein
MLCIPVRDSPRFGGTCRPHHQGWRISQARNQQTVQKYAAPPQSWNLLWFCYCFVTSSQWQSLFRCLVLTAVLGVTATHIGVSCEVRTKLHNTQGREMLKYGHESRGVWKQEWLCWRGPTVLTWPTNQSEFSIPQPLCLYSRDREIPAKVSPEKIWWSLRISPKYLIANK